LATRLAISSRAMSGGSAADRCSVSEAAQAARSSRAERVRVRMVPRSGWWFRTGVAAGRSGRHRAGPRSCSDVPVGAAIDPDPRAVAHEVRADLVAACRLAGDRPLDRAAGARTGARDDDLDGLPHDLGPRFGADECADARR